MFQGVSLSVKQGKLVAISGPPASGKATFMNLIGKVLFPKNGDILVPPHLRVLFVDQEPTIISDLTLWENLTYGCPEGIDPQLVRAILLELGMHRVIKGLEDFNTEGFREYCAGYSAGLRSSPMNSPRNSPRSQDALDAESTQPLLPDDDDGDEQEASITDNLGHRHTFLDRSQRKDMHAWYTQLSYTDRAKIHLSRAIIMNPEVCVLQRPFYHFNEQQGMKILQLVQTHHRNRGLCMPKESRLQRRPRTIFMTTDNDLQNEAADIIWHLDVRRKQFTVESRPEGNVGPQGEVFDGGESPFPSFAPTDDTTLPGITEPSLKGRGCVRICGAYLSGD